MAKKQDFQELGLGEAMTNQNKSATAWNRGVVVTKGEDPVAVTCDMAAKIHTHLRLAECQP